MTRTVVTNCHLIDGVADDALPDVSVVIDDGRISAIISGAGNADAEGGRVIDARGGWLLPGLWDVHVHLMFPDPPPVTLPEKVIKYGLNAIEGLTEGGVTSIRSAGIEHWIDVAWRDAFASGLYLGPRIFASGYFLRTTAGHATRWPFSLQCDGPDGFIRAVREQIVNGVDHIKLNISGGIMGPNWDRYHHSFLLENELEAAFQICKLRGMKVMSHATNPKAVKDAVRYGSWTVEHGYSMDDESVRMMKEHGTIYVPTLGISHLTSKQAANDYERRYLERRQISEAMQERANEAAPEHEKWFREALDSGVKMAAGSDLGPVKDAVHLEMAIWVRAGATPMQAIKAATITSAEACGVADELGTVEVGKLADLIIVGADPLEDIANLRKLRMVIQGGNVVADKTSKVSTR